MKMRWIIAVVIAGVILVFAVGAMGIFSKPDIFVAPSSAGKAK